MCPPLSSCLPSCGGCWPLRACAASDSVWLHLRVWLIPVSEASSLFFFFFWVKVSAVYCIFPFCIRMCEYVDHLHEHFASPVVIRNAHYMTPKVRSIQKVYIFFLSIYICYSASCFQDIGYSCEMLESSVQSHRYPEGDVWKANTSKWEVKIDHFNFSDMMTSSGGTRGVQNVMYER